MLTDKPINPVDAYRVIHPPHGPAVRGGRRMAGLGGKPTFAEALVNGEVVPISDLLALTSERRGSTEGFCQAAKPNAPHPQTHCAPSELREDYLEGRRYILVSVVQAVMYIRCRSSDT
jgi:hypothetical protein